MKKIVVFLFIGLISLAVNAQDNTKEENAPMFEFDSEMIDYGKVDLGADGVRVFKFKNVGKSPLVITKVQSSCGCTVPKKPTEPIMPGNSGEIEVKYDTKRPGGFSKTITIHSNANEPIKRIKIKGIVLKV